MSANVSKNLAPDADSSGPRQHFLRIALCVAGVANALVPAVLFSASQLFGPAEPRDRGLIAAVVLTEYIVALLLLLLHTNVGFASGYTVATAAAVTVGSATLAYITLSPARWGWSALYAEILVVGGLVFAVLSNIVFFVASTRYARAIHPRLHLGGFLLGIAAFLAMLFLYARVLA